MRYESNAWPTEAEEYINSLLKVIDEKNKEIKDLKEELEAAQQAIDFADSYM